MAIGAHCRKPAAHFRSGDMVRFSTSASRPEIVAKVVRQYTLTGAVRVQTVDAAGVDRCVGVSRCTKVDTASARVTASPLASHYGAAGASAALSLPA